MRHARVHAWRRRSGARRWLITALCCGVVAVVVLASLVVVSLLHHTTKASSAQTEARSAPVTSGAVTTFAPTTPPPTLVTTVPTSVAAPTTVPPSSAPPTSAALGPVAVWRAEVQPLWDAYFSPSGGVADAEALAARPPPPSTGLVVEWTTTWVAVAHARQAITQAPPGSGAPGATAQALLTNADAWLRRLEADLLGANAVPAGGVLTGLTGTMTAEATLREGASTAARALGRVPKGATVVIACTTTGQAVTGASGQDTYWDYVHYNGTTGYVTDAFVSSGPFIDGAPGCAGTGGP
jgi:hypothetical protein